MKSNEEFSIDELVNKIISNERKPEAIKSKINEVIHQKSEQLFQKKILNWYAIGTGLLFLILNLSIGVLIFFLTKNDLANSSVHDYERFIVPSVIMALITGISVQTATAFIIMTNFFFAKEKPFIASKEAEVPPNN